MKMHLSNYVGIVVVLTVLAAANSRGRPTLSRFAAQGQATLEKGKAIAADSWARHSVSGAEIVQDLADTLADDALQVGRSGGWIVSPRVSYRAIALVKACSRPPLSRRHLLTSRSW